MRHTPSVKSARIKFWHGPVQLSLVYLKIVSALSGNENLYIGNREINTKCMFTAPDALERFGNLFVLTLVLQNRQDPNT